MKGRLTIITLTLSFFLVSSVIMTTRLGLCDPSDEHDLEVLRGVDIEGAHIVSEGAYFRFWIYNNNTYWPVNVTVDGRILQVLPKTSIDYDVIAPSISVPYQRVIYQFTLMESGNEYPVLTDNFTVLVLSSSYIQISNFIPISSFIASMVIIFGAIIIALVTIAIIRRRQVQGKT
jgi:hypothetical protein